MATYTVKAPDGKTVTLQGPDGASQSDIIAQAQKLYRPATASTPSRSASPDRQSQFGKFASSAPLQAQNALRVAETNFQQSMKKKGLRGPALDTALTTFRSDPRYQALAARAQDRDAPALTAQGRDRLAGRRAAPTRDQQLKAMGQSLSDNSGGSDLGKGLLGGLRAFPGANYLAAAAERYLPAAVTGNNSDASFDDILKVVQARTAADQGKSLTGNVTGQLAGAFGAGGLIAKGVARLAPAGIPIVSQAANYLSRLAPVEAKGLALGTRAANTAKVAALGAVGGGAAAKNQGDDVVTGAAIGAVAAPALGVAAKTVNKLVLQPVSTVLRIPSAAAILRKYVGATIEEIQQATTAWKTKAGTNAEPTVYEVLDNLKDREGVRALLARMPASARDKAAKLVQDRGAAIGPEMRQQLDAVTQPARARITGQMRADMRAARGGAEDAGDEAMVRRASTTATAMPALRQAEARAIMAPHETTPVVASLEDLYPSVPSPNGLARISTDPEVAAAIRGAAGSLGRRATGAGINAGEITDMISKLGDDLDEGVITSGTAQRAIDHLRDTIAERAPQAAQAAKRMTDAFAARSRMGEGVDEGMMTRVRESIPGATNSRLARKLDNAYDTPEGVDGRALGQANRLSGNLNTTPESVLALSQEIATSPGMQSAISANLGGRGRAGAQIAEAAQAQTESARRLAGLGRAQEGQGNTDLVSMAQSLAGLHPGSMPMTKIKAINGLATFFQGVPEGRANQIVDALFSKNPAQIVSALKFFNSAGEAGQVALRKLSTALASGSFANNVDMPASDRIASEDLLDTPLEADPTAEAAVTEEGNSSNDTGPIDEASSPYAENLQSIYQSESPEMLDLIDRVSGQESGGRQHDENGQPLTSSAGAIGVMQVMPDTAPEAARLAGVPWDENAYRNDPAYNKLIGIAYLSEMLRRYDGDVAKATAAYNAGPGRVEAALKSHGDDWLAAVPAETQDYVQKVA